jgi:hypothetical protein
MHKGEGGGNRELNEKKLIMDTATLTNNSRLEMNCPEMYPVTIVNMNIVPIYEISRPDKLVNIENIRIPGSPARLQ